MKYVIFYTTLLVVVPVSFLMALNSKLVERILFATAIAMTCSLLGAINFVSHETYRGTAKGYEITLIDLCALALFFFVLARRRPLRLFPPGTILYAFYFIFSACSIQNAAESLYSYFELLKMARMYFYYWVMQNYIREEEDLVFMMKVVFGAIIYIFLVVMDQKYRMHLFQTNGPFPHQNSLVMYMIVFNSIVFSWLLNRAEGAMATVCTLAIFGMGSICIISTLSRGGMACFALSMLIVLALSFHDRPNAKKAWITIALLVLGMAVMAKALGTIIERINSAPEQSKQTRIDLAIAAKRMADDKFFGVGLNNFGLKINPPYPYSDHIERHDDEFKEGLVETTYLMIAAETGWLNLCVFLLFIMRFYFMNIMNYIRLRGTPYVFPSIGLAGALLAIYLESSLEWVLKQPNNFYQLMLVFAVITATSAIAKNKSAEAEPEDDSDDGGTQTEESTAT